MAVRYPVRIRSTGRTRIGSRAPWRHHSDLLPTKSRDCVTA